MENPVIDFLRQEGPVRQPYQSCFFTTWAKVLVKFFFPLGNVIATLIAVWVVVGVWLLPCTACTFPVLDWLPDSVFLNCEPSLLRRKAIGEESGETNTMVYTHKLIGSCLNLFYNCCDACVCYWGTESCDVLQRDDLSPYLIIVMCNSRLSLYILKASYGLWTLCQKKQQIFDLRVHSVDS